jgi:hypothetical protein
VVVGQPDPAKVSVYAVVRLELDVTDPDLAVAVTEVVPTLEEARAEVERLNLLNRDKNCRYMFRATRYFPGGRRARTDD